MLYMQKGIKIKRSNADTHFSDSMWIHSSMEFILLRECTSIFNDCTQICMYCVHSQFPPSFPAIPSLVCKIKTSLARVDHCLQNHASAISQVKEKAVLGYMAGIAVLCTCLFWTWSSRKCHLTLSLSRNAHLTSTGHSYRANWGCPWGRERLFPVPVNSST